VCETERPQSKVGGGVRDAAEAVFNGVNHLVNYHVANLKLTPAYTAAAAAAANNGILRSSFKVPDSLFTAVYLYTADSLFEEISRPDI